MKPATVKFIRSLIGLILAPLAGGAAAFAGYFLFVLVRLAGTGDAGISLVDLFGVMGIGILGGAQFGLAPAILIGWPVHLLLLRVGFVHLPTYALFGATLGVLSIQLMLGVILPAPVEPRQPLPFELLLLAAVAGAAGAMTFWMIRRPDRDAAPIASSPQLPLP